MYIKFSKNTKEIDCTLRTIKQGVIRLDLKEKPENPYEGFRAYIDKGCTVLIGNYEAYRTKYKDSGNETVLFLSAGEVYKEPPMEEIPESTPEKIAAQEQERKIEVLLAQIAAYKARIDATDYRIVKAYEYSMVGLETEYDMEDLHKERQSYRDAINGLEEKLQKISEKERTGNE